MKLTYTRTIEITDQRTRDLLCCAIEGGSDYWYRIDGYVNPQNIKSTEIVRYLHLPFVEGCGILIRDNEDYVEKPILLNRERMEKGLQLMAEKYPRHFEDFIQENEDAETGDVFLQLSLFGEIVFG